MGKVSTHVLDTMNGIPAAGVSFSLWRLDPEEKQIKDGTTNEDGRTDDLLLGAEEMEQGVYEIRFDVAGYYRNRGESLPEPPFLSIVSIRFGIADPDAGYHVPLLMSPWSYSTYRGS